MRNNMSGLRVVVTGAGSGIGRAIALRLVELGCRVVACGRHVEKLEAVRSESADPSLLEPWPLDVADEEAAAELSAHIEDEGGLDVLVNNAGLLVNRSFDETILAEFDAFMRTNSRGPFVMCKAWMPLLRRSDSASIVNIGSAASHNAYPNQTAYGASKHALLGMMKSLAREVLDEDIRVHVICPGGIATGMLSDVRDDLKSARLIEPDEIADVVEYLITHRGNAVIDEIALRRCGKEPWPWC